MWNKKISMWVVSFSKRCSILSRGAAPVPMSTPWWLQAHSLMCSQSLWGQRGNLQSKLLVGKFREIWGFLRSLELLSDVLPAFQQEAPKRIPPLACDKPSAPVVHLLAKRRGQGWENHSSIFLPKWKHFLIIIIKKKETILLGEQLFTTHLGRTAYTLSPCKTDSTHSYWLSIFTTVWVANAHPEGNTQGPHHFSQRSGNIHGNLENS